MTKIMTKSGARPATIFMSLIDRGHVRVERALRDEAFKNLIENMSSEMDVNHRVFHTALDNHTGVIKQLAQKTSAQSQGLLDHKEHIETTLEALQQQNLELQQHALKLKDQQNTLSSLS